MPKIVNPQLAIFNVTVMVDGEPLSPGDVVPTKAATDFVKRNKTFHGLPLVVEGAKVTKEEPDEGSDAT